MTASGSGQVILGWSPIQDTDSLMPDISTWGRTVLVQMHVIGQGITVDRNTAAAVIQYELALAIIKIKIKKWQLLSLLFLIYDLRLLNT